MANQSTILIDKKTIEMLKKSKEYSRQTYNELLERMISLFVNTRKKDQYDKFLHEIQKPKLKEIWDNKYDEKWENA